MVQNVKFYKKCSVTYIITEYYNTIYYVAGSNIIYSIMLFEVLFTLAIWLADLNVFHELQNCDLHFRLIFFGKYFFHQESTVSISWDRCIGEGLVDYYQGDSCTL